MYTASMRFSTTVDRPIEAVFDYVADLSKHGEWAGNPLFITPSNRDAPIQAGKRYSSRAEVGSLTFEADLEVTEYTPYTRYKFKGEDSTGRFQHTFSFQERSEGVKIDRLFEFELTFTQWLMFYLLYFPVRRPAGMKAMSRLSEELNNKTYL